MSKENRNFVVFIMDSVSYGTLWKSDTLNILELSEWVKEAYSFGTWTIPSLWSMFHGMLPSPENESYTPFSGLGAPFRFLPKRDIPHDFIFVSSNPIFSNFNYSDDIFSNFKSFNDYGYKGRASEVIDYGIESMESTDPPSILYMLFSDTHVSDTHELRKNVKFLDEKVKSVYDRLPDNTKMIVTSDHGNYWYQENHRGHDPRNGTLHRFERMGSLLRVWVSEINKELY